ncbi:unnamed protein product [Ixodes persulcatus]
MLCLSININGGIWWLIVTTLPQGFLHVFGLACTCSLWRECSRFTWGTHSNSVYKCISNYVGRFLLFKWKEKMSLYICGIPKVLYFLCPLHAADFTAAFLLLFCAIQARISIFAHPLFLPLPHGKVQRMETKKKKRL